MLAANVANRCGNLFLSYNRQDEACALRVQQRLAAAGWQVWIDAHHMQAGEDIEHFITRCIRQTDVTLTLISTHSLLSAWVAMETIATHADEQLRHRRFIPCYIDAAFFDRSFATTALATIEETLHHIGTLITEAIQNGWGIENLQSERTRYLKLKANLPEIIGRLTNTLCIDLTDEHFEAGVERILTDIAPLCTTTEPTNAGKEHPATKPLPEMARTILDEGDTQRLQALQNRLAQLRQLQAKYEEELDFETDPKRQMRYEREISSTKTSIEKVRVEINNIHND